VAPIARRHTFEFGCERGHDVAQKDLLGRSKTVPVDIALRRRSASSRTSTASASPLLWLDDGLAGVKEALLDLGGDRLRTIFVDFLQVLDIRFHPLFAFLIVVMNTKPVMIPAATRAATEQRTPQQLHDTTPFATASQLLGRDRYREFGRGEVIATPIVGVLHHNYQKTA
jgi:hypothetical protein